MRLARAPRPASDAISKIRQFFTPEVISHVIDAGLSGGRFGFQPRRQIPKLAVCRIRRNHTGTTGDLRPSGGGRLRWISVTVCKKLRTPSSILAEPAGIPLVLLVVGCIVAKIVAGVVARLLEKVSLDRRLAETDSGRFLENAIPKASVAGVIGRVVFWLVFGFFVVAAVSALHVASVTVFLNQVLAYLPNIIVAILIFVVEALLAGAASKAIDRTMGDSPMGKIAASVAPTLVMVIGMFMILEQSKIADQIVEIAFAATMGAVALGLALAFGLGGGQWPRPCGGRLPKESGGAPAGSYVVRSCVRGPAHRGRLRPDGYDALDLNW